MLSTSLSSLRSLDATVASTSADNSASSSSSSPPRRRASTNTKRKRTDTPSDSTKTGPKKKKANRACIHCQKAHLTCDDSRPCQRCVKRGIANNCIEGHRKKAKYLLDEEELEALKREKSSSRKSGSHPAHDLQPKLEQSPLQLEQPPPPSESPSVTTLTSAPPSEAFMSPASPAFPFTSTTYTSPFDANSSFGLSPNFNSPGFTFGSENATGEYAILSAILGNTSSPPDSGSSGTPPPGTTQQSSPKFSSNTAWSSYTPDPSIPSNPSFQDQVMNGMPGLSPSSSLLPYSLPQRSPSTTQILQNAASYSRGTRSSFHNHSTVTSGTTDISPGHSTASLPPASASEEGSIAGYMQSRKVSLYDSITKSYDYTEGYHFLMKFLVSRFEKNDILRVVRALAIFRPSLIALQMPLAEEDEVFVEKCFQRSLVELEKLISFSGTPTVAWRRTGEICLVGDEFCMLTGWSKEELLLGCGETTGDARPRKTFIYELFENQSVVEYWENFASHAFENTTQSVFSHCVLLKPSGAPVPCTFCFSIRRDLWDLPSLCVGQWLPLL